MDNPCKYCDKADMDFVNECEYGCDNPCQKAKDFYKQVGNKLDELLDKCKQLLRKGEEGNERNCNVYELQKL